MARKKKDSLGLFEVIGKTRAESSKPEVRLPGWIGKRPIKLDAPAASEEAEPQAHPPEPTSAHPVQVVEAPGVAPEPIISTADGRLRVSLNYVSCGVASVALVVLLVVAFFLGRATAPSGGGPAVSVPAGQEQTVRTGNVRTPAGGGQPLPKRISGMYYLVIQRMNGLTDRDMADAQKIVKQCSRSDIKASVGKFPSGKPVQYVVWSLEGFASRDSQGTSEYVGHVHEAGKTYKRDFGKYDFSQLDGSGNFNPWFVQQP